LLGTTHAIIVLAACARAKAGWARCIEPPTWGHDTECSDNRFALERAATFPAPGAWLMRAAPSGCLRRQTLA